MADRLQCRSRHDVSIGDGQTRRLRCQRSVFGGFPHIGPHRAEYATPYTDEHGALIARVASWP